MAEKVAWADKLFRPKNTLEYLTEGASKVSIRIAGGWAEREDYKFPNRKEDRCIAISEECCAPVAYVYGGITLSPKAPGQFSVGVRVDVGVITAAITGPVAGDDHLLWHYLAVVKPGPARIRCTIGDVVSVKETEAKTNQVTITNFCFGDPVTTAPAKSFPKRRKEKEREKVVVKPPAEGEEPRPVS